MSSYFVKNATNKLVTDFFRQTKKDMIKVKNEGSELVFLQKQLNFSYGLLQEEPVNSNNVGRRVEELNKIGLSFFRFRFFDAKSNPITFAENDETLKTVTHKIFNSLAASETNGDSTLIAKNKAYFSAFLGSIRPVDLLLRKSELIQANIKGKPGYFYWNTFYSNDFEKVFLGGMLAWCEQKDIPINFSMRLVLDKQNMIVPATKQWGLINLTDVDNSYPQTVKKDINLNLKNIKNSIDKMSRLMISKAVTDNYMVTTSFFDDDKILYCVALKDDKNIAEFKLLFQIISISFFIFLLKGLICKEINIEMSGHAILIFVFPVLFFLSFAFSYLELSKDNQMKQIVENLSDSIDEVDDGYKIAVLALEKKYLKLALSRDLSALNTNKMTGLSEHFKKEKLLDRVYVFDKSGALRYSFPTKVSGDILKQLLHPAAMKIYAEQLDSELSFASKIQQVVIQNMTKAYTEGLEEGKDLLKPFEKFQKISEFWLTNKRYYVFSSFIGDKKTKDPLLMIIWTRTAGFSEDYLQHKVQSTLNQDLMDNEVAFIMLSKEDSAMPYPIEYSKYRFPKDLKLKILQNDSRQQLITEIGGENYMILASPLKEIPEQILIALTPIKKYEYEYKILRYTILVNGISMILGAFAIYFMKKHVKRIL
ncbi:MAG: hypothetical protein PHF29_05225 [Candidatus Riflebacteria bacterium]|nr:hypothetical protein [Candidatus Riflebacteria bacterium]